MTLATYHVATYRAGENGYYRPLRPDHISVEHDSKRYIYECPRYHGQPAFKARQFRQFIYEAWGARGAIVHISGSWPKYYVETDT